MVQGDACFRAPLRNNQWTFGSAVRFGGTFQKSQTPCGARYYAYAATKDPSRGGVAWTDKMRKTPSFGVGKRTSPGAYPEDLAKQRFTVSPGAYDPSHEFTRKSRTQNVTFKSRFHYRPKSANVGPGPARYDVRSNAGETCRTVRFGTGVITRGSRPSSASSVPGLSPAAYNTRGCKADGGSSARDGCMASCRFRGKNIRDNDPILKEKSGIPGPGAYYIASCFESRWGTPITPGRSRPTSAMNYSQRKESSNFLSLDHQDSYEECDHNARLKRPRSSHGRLQSTSLSSRSHHVKSDPGMRTMEDHHIYPVNHSSSRGEPRGQ